MKIALSFLISAFVSTLSLGQVFDDKAVSYLEVIDNDTINFLGDTLLIDTLIMRNGSTLRLTNDTYILVKNAFIANNCCIDSSGRDGAQGVNGNEIEVNGSDGGNGSKGNNIFLIIKFIELGSLRIDTHGGSGGEGGTGLSPLQNRVYGERGYNGGNGGRGGAGADAGDITFYYASEKFIPRLNRSDEYHSIYFSYEGGACGSGGAPGKGAQGGAAHVLRDPLTQKVVSYTPKGEKGVDGSYSDVCFGGNNGVLFFRRLND